MHEEPRLGASNTVGSGDSYEAPTLGGKEAKRNGSYFRNDK